MDWQSQLISIYLTVSDMWNKGCSASVQRHSNNARVFLTDEEIVTIYFFGIMCGFSTVKEIYDYADRHLRGWFPHIKNYEAFNYRLNRIHAGFVSVCEMLSSSDMKTEPSRMVVDSLPIIMAGPRRSGRARVAPELADKGYCASKDIYFYGVKLHCIGELRSGTVPLPIMIGAAPASTSDEIMFEMASPQLSNGIVFADKAYQDSDHKAQLAAQQIELHTPLKKTKNLHSFSGPETYSTWVSSVRQPIESFFNWLQQKTKIQNASKIRSSAGLVVHVFGRIAAALILMSIFNL